MFSRHGTRNPATEAPSVSSVIHDGAAVVQMLKPGAVNDQTKRPKGGREDGAEESSGQKTRNG